MDALRGCGKCGETYDVGTKHTCKDDKNDPVTLESLQRHIGLLQVLLKNHNERIKNHNERIKNLEMKVYS